MEELEDRYKDFPGFIGVQDIGLDDEFFVMYNDENGSTRVIVVKLVDGEWKKEEE